MLAGQLEGFMARVNSSNSGKKHQTGWKLAAKHSGWPVRERRSTPHTVTTSQALGTVTKSIHQSDPVIRSRKSDASESRCSRHPDNPSSMFLIFAFEIYQEDLARTTDPSEESSPSETEILFTCCRTHACLQQDAFAQRTGLKLMQCRAA